MFSYRFLVFVLLLLFSNQAFAKQAEILLYPTRILIEKSTASFPITLKNPGDATGRYSIEIVDMHMPTEGPVQEVKPRDKQPFSAKGLLALPTQNLQLRPKQSHTLTLGVYMPETLPAAEYRSHLKVTLQDGNVDKAPVPPEENGKGALRVAVQPRFAMVIPIIIRQGTLNYQVRIHSLQLRYQTTKQGKKIPVADILFIRQGNRSSMGDVDITYIAPDGETYAVAHLPGVPIYVPTERRKISIPLEPSEGVTLDSGKLHVTYQAQEAEGSGVIAESEIDL